MFLGVQASEVGPEFRVPGLLCKGLVIVEA